MTKEERRDEYFKLVELKDQLERDRHALNSRRLRFEQKCQYVMDSLGRLEHWDTGATVYPDLREWPSIDDINQLFSDCSDNEKRLSKVKHEIDNYRP